MGVADEKAVGEHGEGIQRHTRAECYLHQVKAREPQGMGGNVGELGPDIPDEGYQGPHLLERQ